MRSVIIAIGCAMVLATPARAESPVEKQAHEHYARAQKLFDAANYDEALPAFQQAYELTRYPAILYKIALCHDQLGHAAEALQSYRAYLDADPGTPRRRGVEARIEKLTAATPAPPPTNPAAVEPDHAAASQPPPPVTTPAPTTTEHRSVPVYKKWWLWTIVGVVAAGAAVGIGVGVSQSSSSPPGSTFPMVTF